MTWRSLSWLLVLLAALILAFSAGGSALAGAPVPTPNPAALAAADPLSVTDTPTETSTPTATTTDTPTPTNTRTPTPSATPTRTATVTNTPTITSTPTNTRVPAGSISAYEEHVCSVADGTAQCWGRNTWGELGNNSTTDSSVPRLPIGLTAGVTGVAAGSIHACAVVAGAAWCWGYNGNGQLGNNSTTTSHVPVAVVAGASQPLTGVSAIAAGYRHSCALVSGGVFCWGYNNHGQLGDNTTTESHVAVAVVDGSGQPVTGVTAISAGTNFTCAIVSGAAMCWGYNDVGQLGTGSTTESHVPVQVTGLSAGVTGVATSESHACAVVSGAAKCWGTNIWGQLGNNQGGAGKSSQVPVDVFGLSSGVTAIGAGRGGIPAPSSPARRSAGGLTSGASSATAPRPTAWRRWPCRG